MNRNPLLVIFLTVFIDLVGFGIIIPLSPFLAQKFGANAFQVGLLMAVYSAAQFLFSPIWGQISDRIGRRPVILISLLGAAIAHLFFGFATELWILFVARIFAGVFGANISTAMAFIADVTDEKSRSKGMGIVGAAFGLGFVLGPAIGGFLARFGFAAPALAASAICFLNFVMAYFVLPESLKTSNKAEANKLSKKISRFGRIKKHFENKNVAFLLLSAFLISFSLSNMEASLFLFVEDRFGWGLEKASFGFAYVGIMMAFTQGYLIRKALPRFGENKLMIIGSILFGLGMGIVGLSKEVYVVAIGMTALALGSGLFNPSVQGKVSLLSRPDEQGEVMGVMQSLSALARILGPPLGGFLYDSVGISSPFLFASGLAGLVVLGLLSLKNFWKPMRADPERFFKIGRFQLENILRLGMPILFLDLQSESERLKIRSHRTWEDFEWIFARSQKCEANAVIDLLEKQAYPKPNPVLLVSYSEAPSLQVAQKLDQLGYTNVYVVSGGAVDLMSSPNEH